MRFALALFTTLSVAGCGLQSADLERPRIDIGLISEEGEEASTLRGPGMGIEKNPASPRVSEDDIRDALAEAPKLDGPPRVAIIEIQGDGNGHFSPVPVAPEELEAFREALGDAAESVQAVPQMFLPRQADLPALRYAAARIGADSLFVFGRGSSNDTYFNGWSNLNWLIIPIFAVPGRTVEVYAAAEGTLIDVLSSRVRAVTQSDKRLDMHIITASSSERPITELEREAGMETVKGLGAGLSRELTTKKVGQK